MSTETPPQPAVPSPGVVVAEVVRSGFVEGRHHGSLVALGPGGEPDWAVGDAVSPVLPRSCNKPLQATAMVRLGLDLPPDLLALASASHSGEPFHVEGVRRILAIAGLDASSLRTPPDWPIDVEARDDVVRAGGERSSLLMNCSGKHAAMLLTCVVNGWSTTDYLDPGHPLQQAVTATFAELTGEPVAALAVDGCGAPLHGTSLTGLARAFGRIASAGDGAEARVADAVRAHPAYVSGTRRDERDLLRAVPGAVGKAGAEACYAVGLPDGSAVALKIHDGGTRARAVVMAAALERSGVLEREGVDADAVRRTGRLELTGGDAVVGEVRAAF
ncbi:asparaginase [Nocardioides zeae]|uniref:Asparaginase n=1 Tax=Nocardioides imazamoxiresistens TaxID=3231893 RepID=A0ABU3PWH3_9ACTN|nr:asparaginase [Nocardioides zeae]MDT9593554.1 asparaginase [Nocardioides zeae]